MCLELQLEESVDDLMQQLGADAKGHISYAQFILCHKNLQLTPGQALYQVRFLKFVFIFSFGFLFLTEKKLLSRRAPIKEALPSPNGLPVLILTPLPPESNSMQCGTQR